MKLSFEPSSTEKREIKDSLIAYLSGELGLQRAERRRLRRADVNEVLDLAFQHCDVIRATAPDGRQITIRPERTLQ